MKKAIITFAAAMAAIGIGSAQAETVTTTDVDVIFVIDSSVSMGGEFSFLGAAISGFLGDLQDDSRIGSAKAGLITYTTGASLIQDLTGDIAALESAFNSVSVSGGTENALTAVDAALPGGNTDLGLTYRDNAVKTVVLITDEDADDRFSYSNSFATGNSIDDINSLIDLTGFLVNIIYQPGSGDAEYAAMARPSSGLFDIIDFRNDRSTFFDAFTSAKIREIVDAGGGNPPSEIPVPAALPLFLCGLGALRLARRRQTV